LCVAATRNCLGHQSARAAVLISAVVLCGRQQQAIDFVCVNVCVCLSVCVCVLFRHQDVDWWAFDHSMSAIYMLLVFVWVLMHH